MAAPQIPNLNTFRRGRMGRPMRRGGGLLDDETPRPSGKDRVVQGTDNDASVSRLSAVELGYLDDPFATALTPASNAARRLPIINRGTYVRTTAIDQLVARFLGPYSPDTQRRKQIISLGAGSDTRVFRFLSSRRPSDLVYHELDFATNTTAKIRAIRSTRGLQEALGLDAYSQEVSISEDADALHSPSYHIHPLDLRSLWADRPLAEALPGVDPDLPTLLISECCLVYLSPTEASQVVAYFTKHLGGPATPGDGEDAPKNQKASTPLGLILYEPIRPGDAFGRTMVSNLAARGIHLQTLHKFDSLDAQRSRLHEQGFGAGQCAADIEFLWKNWVSESEKERVAGLEMLDEMEEWQLLARHYCIAWGWHDGEGTSSAFNGWTSLRAQQGA